MSASRALVVGAAMALVAAGCGGDGDKAATTTSPTTSEETTTTLPATTTTTEVEPALESLLLVKADLPNFKEQAEDPAEAEDDDASEICDDTETPALTALDGEPEATGKTFERGSPLPVEVSSFAGKTTPEKAKAALDELVDPKVRKCFEDEFRADLGKDLPAGVTVTVKVTSTETTLTGIDQVAVLSAVGSVKGPGATQSFRVDLVFLRVDGTILGVTYGGAGPTSVAERQRIVTTAARKLTGTTTSGTSTTRAGGSGSTSTTSRSSTTRRSTSTTARQGGSTTSTTR